MPGCNTSCRDENWGGWFSFSVASAGSGRLVPVASASVSVFWTSEVATDDCWRVAKGIGRSSTTAILDKTYSTLESSTYHC